MRHGVLSLLFGLILRLYCNVVTALDRFSLSDRPSRTDAKPRKSRRPSTFEEFKAIRKSGNRSKIKTRNSVYEVDFATFLEANEFETRLLQTAAADALELFFTSLDIIFDKKWVEYEVSETVMFVAMRVVARTVICSACC